MWLVASEVVYKLAIALRWISGKRHGVSFKDFVETIIFSNRISLGASLVNRVVEEPKYIKIYLKTYLEPVFYYKKGFWTLLYILGENLSPRSWHYYTTHETPVLEGDIVADCGAGVGTFTLLAQSRAKQVFAIEPFPEAKKLLKQTFKNNRKVTILPYILGEKPKKAFMSGDIFGYNVTSEKNGTPIQVTTIDKLFLDKGISLNFLKADLEGTEMQMLEGAKNTIKKYTPKIAITVYHNKNDHIIFMKFLKTINPNYNFSLRGIDWRNGNPILLHAWVGL